MTDSAITNPHDHFFRKTFSQIEVARDFIDQFLPVEVTACLDLKSLELTKESFVDEQLRSSQSDLLYRVNLRDGDEGFVYVLFEHKSTPDAMVSFQLLRYMVRIWEQHQRQGEDLCPIVPLILYHGAKSWNTARTMKEVVQCPESFQRYVPDFETQLYDLSDYSDEELKGTAFVHAALLLLKYIRRDELPDRLPEILELYAKLSNELGGLECLKTVLIYLTSGSDRIGSEYLTQVVHKTLEDQGEQLMPTIAQQWITEGIEKGIEKGREEGREEGLQSGIRAILELRFPEEHRLLDDRVSSIHSVETLARLLDISKTVSSVSELQLFFDGLA